MRLICNLLLVFLLVQQKSQAAAFGPYNFIIENNIIKSNGNIVGRIEFDKQEVKQENVKVNKHIVKIYDSQSHLVAIYNVRSNSKVKKDMAAIFEASLSTIKDNVTHTGSNFLDFNKHEKNAEAIPQLETVISYLYDRKYLSSL